MRRLLALAAMCLASACSVMPPQATSIDATRGHVELAQLQSGRSMLVKKCSGCHATPRPSEHTSAEWPAKLDEMSARAHLDLTERSMIEKYLVVMAKP